ncbi:FHA domain-containing protein [Streptomyces mangrovi]|uniref:FHA domain-containing protein n=1 Tax=Streptomyces mangrovi TaxID=1206892 RepID=UPI00399CA97F
MPTCPNGHQSAADDWCEVCGHRMASAPGVPAGAVPPPPMPGRGGYGYPGPGGDSAAQGELCPQCRTPREGQSPVCEECRYSFLTHSPAAYSPPPPAPPQQMPGGSMSGLNLPPGFQAQGPPSPPPPPAPPPPQQQAQQPMAPPQHHGQPPHAQPQHAQPDYGRSDYGGQPGYGYPQQPPAPQPPQHHQQPQHHQGPPPQQQGGGGDDWPLPPPSHGGQQTGQHGQPPHAQPQHAQPDYGRSDYGGQPGYGYPQQPPAPQPPQHHQQPQHHQGPPPQQQPASWAVTVGPDQEYFTAMMRRSGPEAAGLNMPAYTAEQHVQLSGPQVTIGRRRHSTGESPDIDLGRSPEDPGVSHQHAVLVQQPDGGWSVVDQDSTNGTTVNGAEDPIQPFVPVPLQEGDRVHVGAWTTITLRRG